MSRIENNGGVEPDKMPSKAKPEKPREQEIVIFSDDDRKITREVNYQPREIRIGHDSGGDKFRYTDDTHEELIAVNTKGKNTYLTKAEFDRQVKEILHVDHLPNGIRAEYKNGNIIFINNETNETMTAAEIRSNKELLSLQKQKEINDYIKEHQEEWTREAQEAFRKQYEVKSPEMTQADFDKLGEISKKIEIEQAQIYAEQFLNNRSTFKVDPNWYTSRGVRILEREWSNLAPKSKGFTHEFYQGIVNIAKQIQCNPDDLMSMINSESSFRPDIETGLMGFISDTRKAYDFEPSKLSPVEQLPYIRKCLTEGKSAVFGSRSKHALSPGELYSLIFLPGRFKKAIVSGDPEMILTRKNDRIHPEYYRENKPLDKDGKEYITVQDMAQRIEDFNAYNTCIKYNMNYRGSLHNITYTAAEPLEEIVVIGTRPPKPENKIAKGDDSDTPGTAKAT